MVIAALIVISCSTTKKIEAIRSSGVKPEIAVSDGFDKETETRIMTSEYSDTLTVTGLDGERLNLMKTVTDSAGNTYAHESLDGVVVTARFKNIAERGGKIDLSFNITIPKSLQDPSWQLRFTPRMKILEDTIDLECIYVTGNEYHLSQKRGYDLYSRFLSSIITDSTLLRYSHLIEIFSKRNLSETSEISPQEILNHYRKSGKISLNNHRQSKSEKMYKKMVRNPYTTDIIRLDTVLATSSDIVYCYTQTIQAKANLKKVDVAIRGGVYKDGERLYMIPDSKPITFYISSVSSFAEDITRYVKQVVERRVQANTQAYIDFEQGRSVINPLLYENEHELWRISENIASFLNNDTYDIDSLIITASCSPEGNYLLNKQLAYERAISIRDYFQEYARRYADSLNRTNNSTITIDLERGRDNGEKIPRIVPDFSFKIKSIAENWEKLKDMVANDSLVKEKGRILAIIDDDIPYDRKEFLLRQCDDYEYIRSVLYPYLRSVRFDFHLHRKGMVKDTIHTTTVDKVYTSGVLALKEREYKKALDILKPYKDINTAIAYLSLDYNASAKAILEGLEESAKRDYMLALVHARTGDEQRAVQFYLNSIGKDPAMRFRGNLDPEISALSKKYNINGYIN